MVVEDDDFSRVPAGPGHLSCRLGNNFGGSWVTNGITPAGSPAVF